MNPSELIHRLNALSVPDRNLDSEIGQLMGFTRQLKTEKDGDKSNRSTVWVNKAGVEERMPSFTKVVDDAYLFATTIVPDGIGGASWDETGGSARLANGPYVTAANPAIAVCIATLQHMVTNGYEDDEPFDDSESDEVVP